MIKNYKNLKQEVNSNKGMIIVIVAIIIYTVVWSYISWEQLISLNYTYFDLGSFMERLWFISHYTWSVYSFFAVFSNTGLQFFIFPLTYFHSYLLIVIIQSIAVSLCALSLYGISKSILKSELVSVLIAISFLIYFPVAGSNFFNAHFQTFFPLLFISAYYFYLKKKYIPSTILFLLSGTVRYPYFIFPALFAFLGFVEIIYKRKSKNVEYKKELSKQTKYLLIIFTFSIAFLLIRMITAGIFTISISTSTSPMSYNITNRLMTILLLFGVLLFIPAFSKRWILFFIPSFYLIFFGSNPYYYPMLFHDQYALFIYPFIYLALIDGLAFLIHLNKKSNHKNLLRKLQIKKISKNRKIVITLLSIIIILALLDTVYEPYGPYNSGSNVNYGFGNSLKSNSSQFEALSQVTKLIPDNNPYILTQNNLIEIYPREMIPPNSISGLPLIAGMLDIGKNLSINEISENKIPIVISNNITYTNVDYILADVYSSWYNFNSYGYPSMSFLIAKFYNSGFYGMVAEDNGIILLERGYTGKVKLYSPINEEYTPSQFSTLWYASHVDNEIIIKNAPYPNIDGLASWYGPCVGLPKGTYRINFILATSNNSIGNHINLDVYIYPEPTNLVNETINGKMFNQTDTKETFSLTFHINKFISNLQFRGIDAKWSGTLIFYGVSVKQLSS